MDIRRFTLADLPASPWKNGGGSTTEIWNEPPGAGLDDFVWRVSVATIASDGPFSVFNGVDRVITLLQGSGVRLCGPEGILLCELGTPLAPYVFAGETPVHATRMGGNSLDFNVMTRRGKATARVRTLRCEASPTPVETTISANYGLVFCVPPQNLRAQTQDEVWRGQVQERPGEETLTPGQGLYWSCAQDRNHVAQTPPNWQWRSAGGAGLLVVSFDLQPAVCA